MMTKTAMLMAAAALLGSSAIGQAQMPYPAPYPDYRAGPYPPSWSYDPYTSGIGTCVQSNRGNSPACKYTIDPTYGQPNYWPYHGG